jgi:hypothetical protein
MYIYCILPFGKLKSNFIKIESLKRRYGTYYGSSHKSYHIRVNCLSLESIIHKKLKDMNLHIENELFMYNELYDFNFYVQQISKIHFETIIKDNYCIHKYIRGKLEKKLKITMIKCIFALNMIKKIYPKKKLK